ncbi:MAG: hypothetical protein QME52_03495, partial [Bacteroidota bacterium]|nr:hypothetical protein [Bacteroidota bacterium]
MINFINILNRVIATSVIILIISTIAISQTWTSLQGPPKARDVKDIAVTNDGQTLYACDKSVLFKSTNGGTLWTATQVELASPLVVVCKPNDANNVVVGIQNYIKLNTNGGSITDWQDALTNAGTPLRLAVSPITNASDTMYLGRKYSAGSYSVYFSSNGGADWFNRFPSSYVTDIYDIAPYPVLNTNYKHVWVCGSDTGNYAEGTSLPNKRGVFFSRNAGENWTSKGMDSYNLRAIAIKDASPPNIFVGTAGTPAKFFVSIDTGLTWIERTSFRTFNATVIRAIRVRNNSDLWLASDKGLYRSFDNGTTWANLPMPNNDNNILSLVIAKNGQDLIYTTTQNSIYKTTNAGTSWSRVDSGLGRMPVSSVAVSSNNYWTVSDKYDSLGRFDGSKWSIVELHNFRGNKIIQHPDQTTYIYATGYSGSGVNQRGLFYRSVDSGKNYTSLYTTSPWSGNIFNGITFEPNNTSFIYLYGYDVTGASNPNFYKIPLYGAGTKEPFSVGGSSPLNTVNDVIAVAGTQIVYYGLDNIGVYRSLSGPSNGNSVSHQMTVRSPTLNASVSTTTLYVVGPSGLWRWHENTIWYPKRNDNLKKVIMRPGYTNSKNHIAVLANDGNTIWYTGNAEAVSPTWVDGTGGIPKLIYDISNVPGDTTMVIAATDCG